MKPLKKTCIAALAIAMSLSFSSLAGANDSQNNSSTSQPSAEQQIITEKEEAVIQKYEKLQGTITSINKNLVTLETQDKNLPEITLVVSDTTILMDNEKGLPVSADTLQKGDKIAAYYSKAMTKSLPPQSSAIAILTNLETKSPATLLTVQTVTKNQDENIRVLTQEGSLTLIITKDTPITPFKTKNIATMTDIQPGTTLLAWFEMVAESYPAQATANQVVLLNTPASQEPVTPQNPAPATQEPSLDNLINIVLDTDVNTIIVNGKTMNGTPIVRNEVVLVPVREIAETLGFKVTWEEDTQNVVLDNGIVRSTALIGFDGYYKNIINVSQKIPIKSLGAAPELIEKKAYVPALLFNLLLNNPNAVTTENHILTITTH